MISITSDNKNFGKSQEITSEMFKNLQENYQEMIKNLKLDNNRLIFDAYALKKDFNQCKFDMQASFNELDNLKVSSL